MRKVIAALMVSVDGYIEGPNGEIDWIDSWEDCFDLLDQIDTCVLGGKMYPGYEQYWGAIQADPSAILPFSGKRATAGEVAYAEFAAKASHLVLSSTLQSVSWSNTRIVRSVADVRYLKQLVGKDIHAVGGGALVSSLINAGLVDELRLVMVPVVLGAGKPLFQGIESRHRLQFSSAKQLDAGLTRLTYKLGA